MRLINFLNMADFNKIRDKMNADLIAWDSNSRWKNFDPFEFRKKLAETGEVDIPFKEIEIVDDGTFELFGEKILVYIRDQRAGSNYKFHICDCRTLREARTSNRYKKYVASVNTDGVFQVNLLHNYNYVEKDQRVSMKVV